MVAGPRRGNPSRPPHPTPDQPSQYGDDELV